jgi:hypothetical protein
LTGPTSGPGDYYQYKKAKEYLDKRKSGGGGSVKGNSGGGGSKKILGIILGIIVFLIAVGILSNS